MMTYEFVGQYPDEKEAIEDCMWRAQVEGISHRRFLKIEPFDGRKGGKRIDRRSGQYFSVFIRGRDPVDAK